MREAAGDAREGSFGYAFRWALLVVAIVLIVVLRTPDAILLPSLEAEDGTFVFSHYYAHRDVSELLRFQAGYIPLTLNLIAYLAVRLPTPWIPYGFSLLPLLLAIVAYTWLFARRFRPWLGADATRALICVLFVLAPVAQYHIYANATYSIWNALLLLVLLVVTPRSPVPWRNVASWAVTNILAWSNPLTILVAPLVAIRFVRERSGRILHALTLANLVLYHAVGVEKGGIFSGLTWIESLWKLVRAIGLTFVVVAGTAFRTVFGAPLFGWAEASFWPAAAAWALAAGAAVFLLWRRSPESRVVLCVLGYVIFAFTFVSLLSRGPSVMIPLNGAPRYIYLPALAFLVLFVLLLERLVVRADRRRRVVAYGAVIVWYVVLNAQLGHYFVGTGAAARPADRPSSPYVQSSEGNGRIVRDFFAELARQEAHIGSREGIYLKSDKPSDWPIIADTRVGPPKP